MAQIANFPNFGILKEKLPNELFLKLIAESQTFKPNGWKTGLDSGLGVAKHTSVIDTRTELSEYVMMLANQYNSHFNYLSHIKTLNKSLNLIAGSPWFNYQKKHEYIPNHYHDGIFSYSGWIKIPYNLKDEHINNIDGNATASTFEFTYNAINGGQMLHRIPIDSTWEGHIIMFPANLQHCVYPFYTSDDTRISFSGNILLDTGESND